MKIEKDQIESRGFPEWDRRDYQKFIQGLELFATHDYENISRHMEGTKSREEVQRYAMVFFEKVDSLNDSDKIKAKINKAQKNVSFNLRAPTIINQKVDQLANPYEDMVLPFATQKSKFFSKESDVILLCLTHRHGYGDWDKIKTAVRRETRCRLDHLFISRSEEELKKRVIYLVQCLEKELEEEQSKPKPVVTTQAELDRQMEQLMLEAEQKADDAMQNLTMTSVIRLAQTGLGDKEPKADKLEAKSSQNTHKSEETGKQSSPHKEDES